MVKKISLGVVVLIGAVWLVASVALDLFHKGTAVDKLTTTLEPAFSDTGVAQWNSDAKAVNEFVADLNATTVPLVAKLTNQTDAQVVQLLSDTFPTVGKLLDTKDNAGQPYADGKTYLSHAAGYIDTVAKTFDEQQVSFPDAQQIPIKSVDTPGLAWLFAILGVVVLGFGVLFVVKPAAGRPLGAALAVVSLVVVAVTLIISVPRKTQHVDDLTNAFRPVFATSGPMAIEEGQAYLAAVRAADKDLETKLVPTLATVLKLDEATVVKAVSETSPKVAGALFGKDPANPKVSPLVGILDRWDGVAATVVAQRDNFKKVDNIPGLDMPTTMTQFLLVGPALLLVLAGIGFAAPSGTRKPATSAPGRAREMAGSS